MTISLCYDAAGNVIFDNQLGDSGDRLYDAENRMTSAVGVKGSNSSYSYDADGRRTRRQAGGQTFWQVYGLGGELVAEYLWNGTTATLQKEYGYRGGEMLIVAETASTTRWLVTDHLGTPRIIADQTGSLAGITRHDYLPFGEENFAGSVRTGNGYQKDQVRQQFTGYEHDTETDLDFAEARYCSTKQGRFISVDPLHSSAEITEPQSWNRYSYVGNRPLTITDPNGLKWAYKTDKNGFLHFKYFDNDADAVAQGWTVIQGNYFYIGSNGHVIGLYTNGGGRDFGTVRQASQKINIWADTPETNAIVSLWIKSVVAGATLGYGAAAGVFSSVEVAGASAYYADGIVRGGGENAETAGTIRSDRQAAVRDAWRQEAELVERTGSGTNRWTQEELKELRTTGKVSGYEGHHINDVNNHPEMARDPNNIKFVKGRGAHLSEHGGNFKNKTTGKTISRR